MCWIGRLKNKHIAEGDVKVFKIVFKEVKTWKVLEKDYVRKYYAPYRLFTYEISKTYSVDKLYPVTRHNGMYEKVIINEGFHSYSCKHCMLEEHDETIEIHSNKLIPSTITHYEKGYTKKVFEGYKFKYSQQMGVTMLECVIPAGTEYWENENGEIVSQKIKIIREVKI